MKLATIQEAAEYLGIHPDTLRDWESRGYIKSARTPGGHRRFDLEELKYLMCGRKTPPKLSITERRMLVNQHHILERLCPDEADYHKERAEIYQRGYELLYDDDWVDPMTISDEQCWIYCLCLRG
jgi:excisionase family DNA binding protein